ncbi:Uncharacterised protein [Mycobacteroides abscessus subsp. abscessus]|nr:Uncharacterised protein [Mycobacteroides abscessus subsp. abscessus]
MSASPDTTAIALAPAEPISINSAPIESAMRMTGSGRRVRDTTTRTGVAASRPARSSLLE